MHGLAPHDPSYFAGQYGPAGYGNIHLEPGLQPPAAYPGGLPTAEHAQPAQLAAAPEPAPAQSRLRWGRLFVLILGVGLVAFAVTNLVASSNGPARDSRSDKPATSAGDGADAGSAGAAGAPTLGTDPATDATSGLDLPSIDNPPTPSGAGAPMIGSTSRSATTPRSPGTNASRSQKRGDRSSATTNGSRSGAQRPATGGGANQGNRPSTAQGGGAAGPDSSLPYTGASAWIAAVIGVLALGAGMLLQLKALQIGEAASLYRRGPLLRPLWLIGLTLRNAPHAVAWGVRNAPALNGFLDRARTALDARGDGAEEFMAARRA